jgi:secreted trypsin-like serine protease
MTILRLTFILTTCLFIFSSCNKEGQHEGNLYISKITSGDQLANPGEFSWLVKVDTCAGVIINKRFILTVAHCVFDKRASLITLRAGSNGTIKSLQYLSKAKKIIIHPDYKPFKQSLIKENDIAIIELKEDIIFTNSLNKAKLPNSELINHNERFILGGYGRDEDHSYPKELRFLRELELLKPSQSDYWNTPSHLNQLISDDENQDFIGTYMTDQYLAVKVINNKSACRGDSGAPLVTTVNNIVIGLVSHGSDDCINQKAFFLTKVSHYTNWINQVVNNED